ncbi:mannose-1-phosphate guanylyltransferase/mannose-6-phosphate isomerase, partial [Mesorhizobium sp. M3A.F.Ca.ET.201.01.1.1]
MKIVPVIISGGVGSRLWPISRALHPKPFIPLPEGGTLIRKTYARAVEIEGVDHVVTVTNRDLLFLTADEYAEVAASGVKNTFLLEPFGRDTAAAIALAALQVARQKPEAILLVL